MSTTEIRSSATDQYTIFTSYDASNNFDLTISQALVQSAYGYDAIPANEQGNYISPVNLNSWTETKLDANYADTSAIANYPSGTLGEYSAISSELISHDFSSNIYTTPITTTTSSFQSVSSVNNSYYDSNYVFTQSLLADCSDNSDLGTFVKATFDLNNANITSQYATQSRWNTVAIATDLTTVGPDPVSITQDVSLNTLQSFAKQGTGMTDASYVSYWAALNTSNGDVLFNVVDASYQPINNNLLVGNRDMTEVILTVANDVGIFRIQQADNTVSTQVAYNTSGYTDISSSDLANMPLFDGIPNLAYNSTKNSLPVPGTMSIAQFQTLVNPSVYNNVCDGWQFVVDISSNGGGYTLPAQHPLMSELDNSNLLDNPYYMANYVSTAHSIRFSNSTVTISPSTNGTVTDATSINIDLTNGETLSQPDAGHNGQFIIYTNTPTTRIDDLSGNTQDLSGNEITFTPSVLYSTDSETNSLSSEEMTNPYFGGLWQKVVQESATTDPSYYAEKSGDAIMTLYANGIVDSSYVDASINFSFTDTNLTNDINLWKVSVINNSIQDPQSFYQTPEYTEPEMGITTGGVITNVITNPGYSDYRVVLTAKEKENTGLYSAVMNNESGKWSLDYSTGSFLESSSTQAYSENAMPRYDASCVDFLQNQEDAYLNFSYTYKTIESSTNPGGLSDYVEIVYNYSTDSSNMLITIPQTEITRVYDDSSSNVTYIPVSDSSYSFVRGVFKPDKWELVQVNARSVYNASFNPNYGPFTNLVVTISDIHQLDTYYAVRNKHNGKFAGQTALNFISTDIPNLKTVAEQIDVSGNDIISINGTFASNDLKPFLSNFQGELEGSWTIISSDASGIDTDVYYGLDNSYQFQFQTGNLTTNLAYTPFSDSTQDSIIVELVNINYYIPIIFDAANTNYSLQSYVGMSASLSTNTDMSSNIIAGNLNTLNLSNGYADVTQWDTLIYQVTAIVDSSNEIVTLTVTDGDTTVFIITLPTTTVFLGQFLVSYIPLDCYRVERFLGISSTDASGDYNEQFITEDYAGGIIDLNIEDNLQGIQISYPSKPVLGNYQQFRVIGDYMIINEVGTTTGPPSSANELGLSSYNSGSLVFQYVSGANHSAAFDFPTYRGYNSYAGNQVYTINRGQISVTFIVEGEPWMPALTQNLTEHMYYGQSFTVNSLSDDEGAIANLNVSGSFTYSIPPTHSTLTYPVTVTGDSVNVSIVNPNYLGNIAPVVDQSATQLDGSGCYTGATTLKSYGTNNAFTFSGTNWNDTDTFMAFRPSRVKLNNTAFPYNDFKYKIALTSPDVTIYKALSNAYHNNFNWLGNPTLLDFQLPNTSPNTETNWAVWKTLSIAQMYNGFTVGVKHIYQNPNLAVGNKLAYIISVPPYYQFEQMTSTISLPYDYTSSNTTIYSPYISIATTELMDILNPFVATTYYDINGNRYTISGADNATYLNNIAFTLLAPPSITDAVTVPDSTRYGIIVHGTNISVSLYSGLYNSTLNQGHTNPIWNGPITSLPSTLPPNVGIDGPGLIFRSKANSGTISFSALQYPADIGYPAGATGYTEILGTTDPLTWYNIDFTIGNSGWFNHNNPVTYFNEPVLTGVNAILYTVTDVNNPSSQINKRRVYKYTTTTLIDLDTSGNIYTKGSQTFNLVFTGRQYHDFDITSPTPFPPTPGYIWKYNTLLHDTVIPPSEISWTIDASYVPFTYVSWSFGNSDTVTNMLNTLFKVDKLDGEFEKKWVYIQLEPFMRYLNQFNLPIGSVAWDGSVACPLLSTRVVNLAPGLTTPILLNNTYTIEQYSESTV